MKVPSGFHVEGMHSLFAEGLLRNLYYSARNRLPISSQYRPIISSLFGSPIVKPALDYTTVMLLPNKEVI